MKTLNVFFVILLTKAVPSFPASLFLVTDYSENSSSESKICYNGLAAYLPDDLSPPTACKKTHEVYACAYGEARCDGLLYCGTPPCTWGCWCRSPYKRDSEGKCVIWCKSSVASQQLDEKIINLNAETSTITQTSSTTTKPK